MLGLIMSGTEIQSTKTADCLVTPPASLTERHRFVLRVSRDIISLLPGRGPIGFFFLAHSLRVSVGRGKAWVDAPYFRLGLDRDYFLQLL